jgi:hypothetical protein
VLVLLALLVAADRVGAAVAERALADELQRSGGFRPGPEVDVRGVPFLTQACAAATTASTSSPATSRPGEVAGTPGDAVPAVGDAARRARAAGDAAVGRGDVGAGRPRRRPGAAAVLRLQRAADVGDLDRRAEGDRLRLRGSVEVSGRTDRVGAQPPQRRGRRGRRHRRGVDVGTSSPTACSTRALAGRFDVRVPLRGLPYGLQVDACACSRRARVTARADDTVLSHRRLTRDGVRRRRYPRRHAALRRRGARQAPLGGLLPHGQLPVSLLLS